MSSFQVIGHSSGVAHLSFDWNVATAAHRSRAVLKMGNYFYLKDFLIHVLKDGKVKTEIGLSSFDVVYQIYTCNGKR